MHPFLSQRESYRADSDGAKLDGIITSDLDANGDRSFEAIGIVSSTNPIRINKEGD